MAVSLQSLQNQIRRDPVAYEEDFLMQFRHFQTTAEALHLNPGRPSKNFSELCSFVAHVYYCYPSLSEKLNFEGLIFRTLAKEPERLHHSIRKSLVQAAFLLRSRGCSEFLKSLQQMFKLFGCEDKDLRKQLLNGLLADISSSTTSGGVLKTKKRKAVSSSPPGELRRQAQSFLVNQLQSVSTPPALSRAAAGLLVALFRKGIWADGPCANAIAETCILHSEGKVGGAAVHLFLGNFKMAASLLNAEEDESAKSTKAKPKEGEEEEEDKKNDDKLVDFKAIDLLHDPQNTAELLFARLAKEGSAMSFEFRILLTQLVARLVGRHQLLVLNFYPYLTRYMKPALSAVTKALAALSEATHDLLPPEELAPTIKHIIDNFVADHCKPEVIAIGLNTLRMVCSKCPRAIDADQLALLVSYREHKTSKTVVGAARALLNVYREKFPELLPRLLRGREAAISVQRGQAAIPVYGQAEEAFTDLPGIHRLNANMAEALPAEVEPLPDLEHGSQHDSEEESECDSEDESECESGDESECESGEEDQSEVSDDEEEEEEEDVDGAANLVDDAIPISIAAERFLTDEDFKLMRKRKRDDESTDEDSEEDDAGFQPVAPEHLMGRRVNANLSKKQQKVEAIKGGRTDKDHFKNRERRGGSTNKEKVRNKPVMMSTKKRQNKKMQMSAIDKAKHLKKHIKTLKKAVGPQKRRRAK